MKILVNDKTTTAKIDHQMTRAFNQRKPIEFDFHIDTDNLNLGKILTLRHVLEKHRANSKMYLQRSRIHTKSNITKGLIKIALVLVKPEKPVTVV
jgi:hypothetical protein